MNGIAIAQALLPLWLMAGQAADQAVSPTFSAEVRLVRVDVEVVQGQRPVTGLAHEDFQVTDNGEKRPVRHFSESAEPLDLVLLLDVSGSMKPQLQAVSAAARDAFAVLRPDDRIGIWTFDLKARMITPLSSEHAQVRADIDSKVLRKVGGGTNINGGIDSVAKYFQSVGRTERRRAIVIVTDNQGQKSKRDIVALRKLWEADAVLCAVITPTNRLAKGLKVFNRVVAPYSKLSEADVRKLAEQTGGDSIDTTRGEMTVGEAFRVTIERIRRRYQIDYSMPEALKPGETRSVAVMLDDAARARYPDAQVRARRKYVVPADVASK